MGVFFCPVCLQPHFSQKEAVECELWGRKLPPCLIMTVFHGGLIMNYNDQELAADCIDVVKLSDSCLSYCLNFNDLESDSYYSISVVKISTLMFWEQATFLGWRLSKQAWDRLNEKGQFRYREAVLMALYDRIGDILEQFGFDEDKGLPDETMERIIEKNLFKP